MVISTQKSLRTMVLLAFVLALVGMVHFAAAGPAHAHGGPFNLTVTADGTGGLIVTANYTEDKHPVSEIMDPTAIATSPEGDVVGPVALVSSPEGEGVWVTSEPFIPVGTWIVTVRTTTPEAASATAELVVAELAPPIEAPAADTAEGTGDSSASSGALSMWLWGGASVFILVAAGALIGLRRRKEARLGERHGVKQHP